MKKTALTTVPRDPRYRAFNRVWIELEEPRDSTHARQLAASANRMLTRLNGGTPSPHTFSWDCKDQCFYYGDDMGYTRLTERGLWFSLDYLGR